MGASMSQLVIGLTGGIGSGKTAVSDRFAELGIDIIDADVIARELVAPNTEAVKKIESYFGAKAITPSGELNRAYLREQVFSDQQNKQWLDRLLHPLIRQKMVEQTSQATSKYCILSVPLLIENNMTKMVQRVLVVDVNETTQLSRASNRDQQSEQQIKNIMANQATREQRIAKADDVIDNSGSLQQLHSQVDKLHRQYLAHTL